MSQSRILIPVLMFGLAAWLQAPAQAAFCDDLQHVVGIAARGELASIGTGDIYTGPDSAGHTGVDFPMDDTQRTTYPIDGAKFCGVDTLPQLGTNRYSCEFASDESTIDSQVAACYPQIQAKRDSDGEGTNWIVKGTSRSANINVWAIEPDNIRITISGFSNDDGDDLPF